MSVWGKSEECGRDSERLHPEGRTTTCLDREKCSWGKRVVFTSFFLFSLFNLNNFHILFIPLPISTITQCQHTVTSILVVGRRDKDFSVTQRNPLCVFYSWVSTCNLSLSSFKTIITCHNSLSVLISLSHPFPSLTFSQLVDVINSGLWNVLESFIFFWCFTLLSDSWKCFL